MLIGCVGVHGKDGGFGFVVIYCGKVLASAAGPIQARTKHQAGYLAVIEALRFCRERGLDAPLIYSSDELVIRHQRQVYATAYRMVNNAETAEEIAQETFIRAFKGLRSFRRKAGLGTWLYRITMNLCYDELKRHHHSVELAPDAADSNRPVDSPHEKMAKDERKLWLQRQIESLPFKQRSVLVLRIFQNMSYKDIARTLGGSSVSARVNYRHAILKLKNALAHSGEEL